MRAGQLHHRGLGRRTRAAAACASAAARRASGRAAAHSSTRCTAWPSRLASSVAPADRGAARGAPPRPHRVQRGNVGRRIAQRPADRRAAAAAARGFRTRRLIDARPPARAGRRPVRLGRAEDQPLARPRHRDVQAVELLALARPQLARRAAPRATAGSALRSRRRHSARGCSASTGQSTSSVAVSAFGGSGSASITKTARGLESLGAVHGQQLHRVAAAPARRTVTARRFSARTKL